MLPLALIACTMTLLERHELDRIEQEEDTIDPALPMVGEVTVIRGNGHGCGDRAGQCDSLGLVYIEVSSNDDRTAAELIGYRLEVVGGTRTPEITIPDYAVRADEGVLTLSWVDGASDEQENIDFTVRVTAMDLAGNVSTGAINVPVRHAGQTACECRPGARRRITAAPLALALLALLALRFTRS